MIAEPPIPDPVTPAAAAGAPPAPTPDPSPHSYPLSPVPPLSPSDRTLLFAYFDADDNLAALATTTGQDYFDLLTWLNQPHIQSALESHDQAVARNDRRRSLEALRQALDTADNPTNLRRAATTLLRSTIVRTAPAVNPDRQGGARNQSPPSDTSSIQNPQSKIQNYATSSHAPLPPLPPLPPPTTRPTPNSTPQTAFAHIKAALIAPQLPLALSTLHAHAAHNRSEPATFAGHPIPADPSAWATSLPATLPKDFSLPLDIIESKEVERSETPTGPRSLWLLRTRCSTSIHIYDVALTLLQDPVNPDRQGGARHDPPNPELSCWRLATFDILRRSG